MGAIRVRGGGRGGFGGVAVGRASLWLVTDFFLFSLNLRTRITAAVLTTLRRRGGEPQHQWPTSCDDGHSLGDVHLHHSEMKAVYTRVAVRLALHRNL